MLTCLWDEKLKKVWKTSLKAFNFALFWYICYWAKSSYPICNYKTWHLYYILAFEDLKCEVGFASKLISGLSTFWPVHWLSGTLSED